MALKIFFAVTTEWRSYQDELPENPLTGEQDSALNIAQEAYARATQGPWADTIDAALKATQAIVAAVKPFSNQESLYDTYD